MNRLLAASTIALLLAAMPSAAGSNAYRYEAAGSLLMASGNDLRTPLGTLYWHCTYWDAPSTASLVDGGDGSYKFEFWSAGEAECTPPIEESCAGAMESDGVIRGHCDSSWGRLEISNLEVLTTAAGRVATFDIDLYEQHQIQVGSVAWRSYYHARGSMAGPAV